MSLLINISRQHVIITEHNYEFIFQPINEKLEQAALVTWEHLRTSKPGFISKSDLQQTNKLFQNYGKALYDAILPEEFRNTITIEGPILLQLLHASLDSKPWELLFDGTSFLALTKGIIRVFDMALPTSTQLHIDEQNDLSSKIGLFSYTRTKGRNRPYQASLITPTVEQLTPQFEPQDKERCIIDGNFSYVQFQEQLQNALKVLFFSGQSKDSFWYLDKNNQSEPISFLYPLQKAAEKGLSVLLPFTEEVLLSNHLPNTYKQLDIPYIISLHGFFSLPFYQTWTTSFFKAIIQATPLLTAFRLSLHQIQAKPWIGHDWGFSWLRLHANLNVVNSNLNFTIYEKELKQATKPASLPLSTFKRPFHGQDITRDLAQVLLNKEKKPLWIYSIQQDNLLAYWNETLRFLSYQISYTWSEAVYKEILVEHLSITKELATTLNSLSYFQDTQNLQLTTVSHTLSNQKRYTFITFFVPDTIEETQIQILQNLTTQYDKVVIFSYQKPNTAFDVATFPINGSLENLRGYFYPCSPLLNESDIKLSDFSEQSYAILRLAFALGNEELFPLLTNKLAIGNSWEIIFSALQQTLNKEEEELLSILFIFQIAIPLTTLAKLIDDVTTFNANVNRLYKLHLIEIDFSTKLIRINQELAFFFAKNHHFSIERLHTQADKILIKIIQNILQKKPFTEQIYTLYCLALQKIKTPEYLSLFVLRVKQFLSYIPQDHQISQIQITWFLRFSLRNIFSYNTTEAIFDLVTHILRFLFTIKSYQADNLILYQWLSKQLTEKKQWQLLAEVHLIGASIYRSLGKGEQALTTLNATMKLNQDLQQHTIYYDTLISIALLLLELEDFDEALSIVKDANFNMQRLSQENISKLYFIDGFILKQQNQLDASTKAFLKSANKYVKDIPLSLQIAAYEQIKNSPLKTKFSQAFSNYKKNLAKSFKIANQPEEAEKIYKDLIQECMAQNNLEQATVYTEWLYTFFKSTGNTQELQKTVHQLGQLYYKQEKVEKAAALYAYAQTLPNK